LAQLTEHNLGGGHVTRLGDKTNACRLLVKKPKRTKPFRRQRLRQEDNIKRDLIAEIGMLWTAGFCEHGNETSGTIKRGEILD
jgi:hypothetical protein